MSLGSHFVPSVEYSQVAVTVSPVTTLVPRSLSGLPPTTISGPRPGIAIHRAADRAGVTEVVEETRDVLFGGRFVPDDLFADYCQHTLFHVPRVLHEEPAGQPRKRIDRADLAGRSIRAGLGLAVEGPLADKRRQLLTSAPGLGGACAATVRDTTNNRARVHDARDTMAGSSAGGLNEWIEPREY